MFLNQIQLPVWLTSGMVFQQGVPLLISGTSKANIPVKLEVVKDPTDGRKVSKLDTDYGIIFTKEVRTDAEGNFHFELPSYKPSNDAYTMIFSVLNMEAMTIKDLRCGDVWLMLGSQPLSVPISSTKAPRMPLKEANLSLLRFFCPSLRQNMDNCSYEPLTEMTTTGWFTAKSQKNLASLSAVAFAFAYHLADQLRYPTAVVDLALNDSALYGWLSRSEIENDPELKDFLSANQGFFTQEQWEKRNSGFRLFTSGEVDNPSAEEETPAKEESSKDEKLAVGKKKKTDKEQNPENPVDLSVSYARLMSALYNHFLHPLKGMSLRGLIYAPDSQDAFMAEKYPQFLEGFLHDCARLFGPQKISSKRVIPSLLLLQVQPRYLEPEKAYTLLNLNESLVLARRKLPMPVGVVSIHDMLLPDKTFAFQVGRRLAVIAMGIHFTPKMPKSAPECVGIENIGNKIMLSFNNTGDGLRLGENESVLRGFALCGEDLVYYPAQAKVLHGVRVMVWNNQIPEPVGVTYGYMPIPSEATFCNRTDLPVLPFRSDRSEAVYAPNLTFTYCDRLTFVGLRHKDSQFENLPIYKVYKGTGEIFLETLNKTEGAASLRIAYQPSKNLFSFGPVLRYASLYAPLNLSAFSKVAIDIFNPDQSEKSIYIGKASSSAEIKVKLTWQTVQLNLEEIKPLELEKFEIVIVDRQEKGSIYIDNIRFLP